MEKLVAKRVTQAILPVILRARQSALADSHRFSRPGNRALLLGSRSAKNGDCPHRQCAGIRPVQTGLSVPRAPLSVPRSALPLLLALLLLTACGSLPPENAKPLVAIVGARLVDGSGAAPIEDSVIVIEGTRIRSAGPRSMTPVPQGGEIVNGAGKTVIPGLVDVHVHYPDDPAEMQRGLRAQLYFGVTTVRSAGADTDQLLDVIADLRAGKIAGPRLYTAGRGFTHPQGHPIAHRPDTPDEARQQVGELAAQNVDFLKLWVDSIYGKLPKITPEIRRAIVEEAARHHIPVVAHISDEEDVYQLADLGVNDFLHTVRDKEPDAKFIEFARSRNLTFAPTLTAIQRAWYFAENPQALQDPGVQLGLSAAALAEIENPQTQRKMLDDPNLQRSRDELARAGRFVQQMSAAGVTLLVGSDSGAAAIPEGWGTHNEMALLVDAGLSPAEVIRMATSGGAQRIAKGKPEFGLLEAGNIADLVLLDANPLENIHNTQKIARVMQAGQWLDRAKLLAPQ
jgi:imidazolonepropionase-like amidohydrolase